MISIRFCAKLALSLMQHASLHVSRFENSLRKSERETLGKKPVPGLSWEGNYCWQPWMYAWHNGWQQSPLRGCQNIIIQTSDLEKAVRTETTGVIYCSEVQHYYEGKDLGLRWGMFWAKWPCISIRSVWAVLWPPRALSNMGCWWCSTKKQESCFLRTARLTFLPLSSHIYCV